MASAGLRASLHSLDHLPLLPGAVSPAPGPRLTSLTKGREKPRRATESNCICLTRARHRAGIEPAFAPWPPIKVTREFCADYPTKRRAVPRQLPLKAAGAVRDKTMGAPAHCAFPCRLPQAGQAYHYGITANTGVITGPNRSHPASSCGSTLSKNYQGTCSRQQFHPLPGLVRPDVPCCRSLFDSDHVLTIAKCSITLRACSSSGTTAAQGAEQVLLTRVEYGPQAKSLGQSVRR